MTVKENKSLLFIVSTHMCLSFSHSHLKYDSLGNGLFLQGVCELLVTWGRTFEHCMTFVAVLRVVRSSER